MSDKYKVVIYTDSVKLEEGLNYMDSEGYNFVTLTRGVSGYITVIYEKR